MYLVEEKRREERILEEEAGSLKEKGNEEGGCVQGTRKLVRRISRQNEAARGGAKYRAIDFTARRFVR